MSQDKIKKSSSTSCYYCTENQNLSQNDNLQITDVVSEVALDGSGVSLKGYGSPDGMSIFVYSPGANEWRGVAMVEQGEFNNDSIYSYYIEDKRAFRIRGELGEEKSKEIVVRPTPVADKLMAIRLAPDCIAVSGHVTPPDTTVYAKTRNHNEPQYIGSVNAEGGFINLSLTDQYLSDDNTLQLLLKNGSLETDPKLEPLPLTIESISSYPQLSDVSADFNDTGGICLRATTSPDNAKIYAWNGVVQSWQLIGDAIEGSVSFEDISSIFLLSDTTIRLRISNGTTNSMPVNATLGWHQSRAFFVKSTVSKEYERKRLQQMILLADYQPTGYFALKGIPFSVYVGPSVSTVEICIGTQGLADRDNRDVSAPLPRWFTLTTGENNIPADDFGGIIHVRYVQVCSDIPQSEVYIALGPTTIPIPYYRENKTTYDEWRFMLNYWSVAPESQIVSDRVVLAFLTDELTEYQNYNPQTLIAQHHELLDIAYDIAGLDASEPLHEPPRLLHYVVRAGNKDMPSATNAGNVVIPGPARAVIFQPLQSWMMYHEYGHQQQLLWQINTPAGIVEIVVNIYSLALWRYYGTEPGGPELLDPEVWSIHQKFLSLPREEKIYPDYRDENGETLPHLMALFDQLRRNLGSNFIRNWHKQQRKHPLINEDAFSQKEGMVINACRAAQLDLSTFFADWGLLRENHTDQPIWDNISALGLPAPDVDMTLLPPFIRNDPDEQWLEITDADISINSDGSLSLQGFCPVDGAGIAMYIPFHNEWRGVANVAQGKFSNPSIPASYYEGQHRVLIRAESEKLRPAAREVRIMPVIMLATAKLTASGAIELRGEAFPVGGLIYVKKQGETDQGVAIVESDGTFSNLTLNYGYLWSENLMRIVVRNGYSDSDPISEHKDIVVETST